MAKFVKKPVIIDAVQWTGDNVEEIRKFFGTPQIWFADPPEKLIIHTLEGDMTASAGDWIIRGVSGEYYPCKPDIFAATYDAVSG